MNAATLSDVTKALRVFENREVRKTLAVATTVPSEEMEVALEQVRRRRREMRPDFYALIPRHLTDIETQRRRRDTYEFLRRSSVRYSIASASQALNLWDQAYQPKERRPCRPNPSRARSRSRRSRGHSSRRRGSRRTTSRSAGGGSSGDDPPDDPGDSHLDRLALTSRGWS